MRSGIGKVGGMCQFFGGLADTACSAMGFMGYFAINRLVDTDGQDGQDGKASSYLSMAFLIIRHH